MIYNFNNTSAYGHVFNIGADKVYTINELANTIMDILGKRSDINYLSARNEVQHAYSDHAKLHSFFDITNPTSLIEGVSRTVAWVKQHGARKTPFFNDIEITENLPPIWTEPTSKKKDFVLVEN